jgi:putative redox protein
MTEGWTEISTTWKNGMNFVGQNATGGTVQMGTSNEKPGVGPMQLLLMALAGCTGMDIVSILQKKKMDLVELQVLVRGHRSREYPMIWTDIHMNYLIWGNNISSKGVEQAIRLSDTKYCSVGIMLRKSARITSEYHILRPGESTDFIKN